ncbi:hypothetical protein BN1221_00963 [Brenneria goodwinii]|uniref:Uncharacterized protein n=1 Tax=Brenneria goodwinii TaxID=1109412 RepID=A0A0G4JRP0_9GAMM|nr:hypothetical protein BN1221_00963 [Brenneria goodwinii]
MFNSHRFIIDGYFSFSHLFHPGIHASPAHQLLFLLATFHFHNARKGL